VHMTGEVLGGRNRASRRSTCVISTTNIRRVTSVTSKLNSLERPKVLHTAPRRAYRDGRQGSSTTGSPSEAESTPPTSSDLPDRHDGTGRRLESRLIIVGTAPTSKTVRRSRRSAVAADQSRQRRRVFVNPTECIFGTGIARGGVASAVGCEDSSSGEFAISTWARNQELL